MLTKFMDRLFAGLFQRSLPTDRLPFGPITVTAQSLGREHVGKTSVSTMIAEIARQGPQASGLELTYPNPRGTAKSVAEAVAQHKSMQEVALPATTTARLTRYHLCEADRVRAVYQHGDTVGHLLTFGDDSDKRFQEQLLQQHDQLTAADVLHVYVSCPPDDAPETLKRFQNDLQLIGDCLRAVLEHRRVGSKLAVVVILAKVDGVYATADEARAALTDDRLRALLHRLVLLLERSEKVGLAALIPTSAYGYGTTRLLEPAGQVSGVKAGHSVFSAGDRKSILRGDTSPEPHNLTTLVFWTLMAGLALKPAGPRAAELARTARMLAADLDAMGAWYVPLRCRPTRT